MATKIEEMKDVFISSDKKYILYMLDYIKNDLGISEADYFCYAGKFVICVPKEMYENVLLNGRKFACKEENFNIGWINHYNERRTEIGACDVGYGRLPKILIPGEEKKQYGDRFFWGCIDERTPRTILEYFDSMKDYLKVDKILREYNRVDDALTISPFSPDYDEMSKLFKEFVEKYGYGPFKTIYPCG